MHNHQGAQWPCDWWPFPFFCLPEDRDSANRLSRPLSCSPNKPIDQDLHWSDVQAVVGGVGKWRAGMCLDMPADSQGLSFMEMSL